MQTRDEVRTDVQNQVREAIRSATNAAREAAQEARAAAGQPLPPPEYVIDVLRGEINAAREQVKVVMEQVAQNQGGTLEAPLRAQLAQEQARLSGLQAQLDGQLSSMTSGTSVPTPPMPPSAPSEGGMSENELGAFFFVAAALTVVCFPIARAVARWMDRRTASPANTPESNARLERIEQGIEAVAIEVERISEGQRYNTKLMAEIRGLPAPNPLNEWAAPQPRVPVSAAIDKE
jgi:hypothetical protein